MIYSDLYRTSKTKPNEQSDGWCSDLYEASLKVTCMDYLRSPHIRPNDRLICKVARGVIIEHLADGFAEPLIEVQLFGHIPFGHVDIRGVFNSGGVHSKRPYICGKWSNLSGGGFGAVVGVDCGHLLPRRGFADAKLEQVELTVWAWR
jgi:hypothetical protein